MDSDALVKHVTERAEADREEAQAAIRATLQVLADAVSVEQAHQLAGELGDPLGEVVTERTAHRDGADAERIDLAAFRERVAQGSGLSPARIDDVLGAVLGGLQQAAPTEFGATMEQLPDDLRALAGDAPPVDGR